MALILMDLDRDVNLDRSPCFRHTLVADHSHPSPMNSPSNLEWVLVTSLVLLKCDDSNLFSGKCNSNLDWNNSLNCLNAFEKNYLYHLAVRPSNTAMHRLPSLLHTNSLLPVLCQYFSYSEYVYYQTNSILVIPVCMIEKYTLIASRTVKYAAMK